MKIKKAPDETAGLTPATIVDFTVRWLSQWVTNGESKLKIKKAPDETAGLTPATIVYCTVRWLSQWVTNLSKLAAIIDSGPVLLVSQSLRGSDSALEL